MMMVMVMMMPVAAQIEREYISEDLFLH
jgi:hypothetical protein